MKRNDIVKKNLDLHAEWVRYVFEHPEVLDKISKGTQIVIIPTNDAELAKENQKIAQEFKSKGIPSVIIHIELPKHSSPQIEFSETHH